MGEVIGAVVIVGLIVFLCCRCSRKRRSRGEAQIRATLEETAVPFTDGKTPLPTTSTVVPIVNAGDASAGVAGERPPQYDA